MEKELPTTTELRDRIDAHVAHISAWTTILEALEQKTPETLQLPSSTIGEVARSIQKSTLMIQQLVDSMAAAIRPEN